MFSNSCYRYLDRLTDSLQQKLKVSEKMVVSSKLMAEKRDAASKEQMDLEPKLEVIRSKTKEVQRQVFNKTARSRQCCFVTLNFIVYCSDFHSMSFSVLCFFLFLNELVVVFFCRLPKRFPRNTRIGQ